MTQGVSARRRFFALGRDVAMQATVRDLSPFLMDVSPSLKRATEMDTTYDPDGARRFEQTRIQLLRDGTLSASGRWQPTVHRILAAARASVLADDQGRGLPFALGPNGYGIGAVMQTGQLILTGYSMTFPKTGIDDFTLQAQINGAVTERELGSEADAAARLAALTPSLTLDPSTFSHGVAGYRTCVFMGGYDGSRWFDTFGVNGTVGTILDGGFKPPGGQQEHLTSYGDHTFTAGGPWTKERHQRLIAYLGADGGQTITLVPGGVNRGQLAGDPALLFTALQTQFDLQGRYDDKAMHSLSLEAGDDTAINGIWFGPALFTASGLAASDGGVTNSVELEIPDELRKGNGIINVHLIGGPPDQADATFAVDSAPAGGTAWTAVTGVDDLAIGPRLGSGVIQMPAEWPANAEFLRLRMKSATGTFADTEGNRASVQAAFGI